MTRFDDLGKWAMKRLGRSFPAIGWDRRPNQLARWWPWSWRAKGRIRKQAFDLVKWKISCFFGGQKFIERNSKFKGSDSDAA